MIVYKIQGNQMKDSVENNSCIESGLEDTTPKKEVMTIHQKKKILHDYILLKLEENDLHGISDAANDLRVIEAYDAGMNAAIDLQRLQDKLNTSNSGEIEKEFFDFKTNYKCWCPQCGFKDFSYAFDPNRISRKNYTKK